MKLKLIPGKLYRTLWRAFYPSDNPNSFPKANRILIEQDSIVMFISYAEKYRGDYCFVLYKNQTGFLYYEDEGLYEILQQEVI